MSKDNTNAALEDIVRAYIVEMGLPYRDHDSLMALRSQMASLTGITSPSFHPEVRRNKFCKIDKLKALVVPYVHDPKLPPLPCKPDGQLHGVGFIYDEDRDDRVLVAIDEYLVGTGVVAIREHEGTFELWSRENLDIEDEMDIESYSCEQDDEVTDYDSWTNSAIYYPINKEWKWLNSSTETSGSVPATFG